MKLLRGYTAKAGGSIFLLACCAASLLARMKPEEKVRQLDLYAGTPALMSAHTDDTHATKDAAFLPEKAEKLWGDLGAVTEVLEGRLISLLSAGLETAQ
jgi:hypothetical protein